MADIERLIFEAEGQDPLAMAINQGLAGFLGARERARQGEQLQSLLQRRALEGEVAQAREAREAARFEEESGLENLRRQLLEAQVGEAKNKAKRRDKPATVDLSVITGNPNLKEVPTAIAGDVLDFFTPKSGARTPSLTAGDVKDIGTPRTEDQATLQAKRLAERGVDTEIERAGLAGVFDPGLEEQSGFTLGNLGETVAEGIEGVTGFFGAEPKRKVKVKKGEKRQKKFKTPEDVREAVRSGQLPRAEALRILQKDFKFK